ncbi:MAG: hypothetical protein SFX74_02780 [Fimbriimonadaceae bacterium]|nr:hypothetical protein [Fimbriimonadaceae bacterium]
MKLIATALVLASLAVPAFAQDDLSTKIVPRLEYEQADVREALKALFKAVGVPGYTIDPAVQGSVTVNLTNVTFDVALQSVLRQVDATYRVEGGVYQIIRKEIDQTPTNLDQNNQVAPVTNKVIRRIPIKYGDPQVIAILIGAQGGSQDFGLFPERSTITNAFALGGAGGGMGGGMGGMGGGMGGMMGGMGGGMGGMMGGMGGGMMGGMGGGGMMGGMGGGGMMGGMGGMGGGMGGRGF